MRATGTTDYLADVETSRHEEAELSEMPSSWDAVQGELLAFDDPEERLPVLDSLEGFHPGGFHPGEKSLYRRVLIPATLTQTGTTVLAWVYTVESASGLYLPGGRWPAP